jgi:hypothetical protein
MKLSWYGEVSPGNKRSITSGFLLYALVVIKLVIFKLNAGDPRLPFALSIERGIQMCSRWIHSRNYQSPPSGTVTTKIICSVKPHPCLLVGI